MKDSGNKIFIEKSMGEIIQGRNSFDIIRYFLSFAVLVDHFSIITGASYYFLNEISRCGSGFFYFKWISGFL